MKIFSQRLLLQDIFVDKKRIHTGDTESLERRLAKVIWLSLLKLLEFKFGRRKKKVGPLKFQIATNSINPQFNLTDFYAPPIYLVLYVFTQYFLCLF